LDEREVIASHPLEPRCDGAEACAGALALQRRWAGGTLDAAAVTLWKSRVFITSCRETIG